MPTDHPITPLPIPRGTRRVLLVGGTFDPPHRAHATMAELGRGWLDARDPNQSGTGHLTVISSRSREARAAAALGPATLIAFVPTARSPFKPPPIASDAARVEMVRAMAADVPGSIVWTDEIDRARPPQPGYWIDTLERARAATAAVGGASPRPSPDLCFLIGADQAISLHRWREAHRLLELAKPVIVLRPPITTREQLGTLLREAAFWTDAEIESLLSRIVLPTRPYLIDVSATAIRDQLAQGTRPSAHALSHAVLDVIDARGLYKSR